ncbi:MAG: hypothetical protein ACP5VN_08920 [Acidobacteriota bacterium]
MRKLCVIVAAALFATAALAQQTRPSLEDLQKQIEALQQQMQQMMQNYQSQIQALQQQVQVLQARQAAAEPASAQAMAPPAPVQGSVPPIPAAPPSPALQNPAISVLPDFTFSSGNDPFWKSQDALQVREVEVAFSSAIDPYATANVFLSLEDGAFNVEEAYAAFPGLPGGWTMKLGKFKMDFGKQNAMHTHTWFQADPPLALRTMLGEEGLSEVGVSFSHLLPTPWMSDLTFEVTGARNDTVFGGKRSDLSYLAAWRNFWDLSDHSSLEAQLSLVQGKNAAGHGTGLGNLAVTYRYKPLATGTRASFLWRTELIRENYRGLDGLNRSTGAFSYVDWQFTRGWFAGLRADYAEHPQAPWLHDKGGALTLTYFPSEFQKFRLQFERIHYAGVGMRNALVFEYGFAIGPHGAHPF